MLRLAFLFLFSLLVNATLLAETYAKGLKDTTNISVDSVVKMEWKVWKSPYPSTRNEHLWTLYQYYKNHQSFTEGYQTLVRMDKKSMGYQEGLYVEIQKGLLRMLSSDWEGAAKICLAIENDSLDSPNLKLLYPILLISLIEKGEYRLSQSKFENYLVKLNLDEHQRFTFQEQYRSKVIELNSRNLKSIRKARLLSILLPPSGLFYAGKPGKAFTNLGLQAAAAGYLAFNIITQSYFTAATFNFHLVRLFYTGGVNQTNALVKEYNQKMTSKSADELELLFFHIAKNQPTHE